MPMSTIVELTQKQKDELFDEYDAAMKRGDYAAVKEIGRKLPIHPNLVPFVKAKYTPEKIRQMGLIMPIAAD